jgi:galactose oxidase-like protein
MSIQRILVNMGLLAGLAVLGSGAAGSELPANTWVRIADCPGDAEGREVPPGRAATWCYVPPLKAFVRYGGYTPRFSNAMDKFDPATKKWTRLLAEDENYPADRPGGSCRTALAWDPGRKVVLIGGGLANGYTGVRGLWSWDPKTGRFTAFVKEMPRGIGMGCFDVKAGLYVAQPWSKSSGLGRGTTMIFSMAEKKWLKKRHKLSPQPQWGGHKFPMVFNAKLGKVLLVSWEKKGEPITWAFDSAGMKWEKLPVKEHPPARVVTAIAYDPVNAVVLMHGGSDGKLAQKGTREDTWVLDLDKKKWRELKTPGPPAMKGYKGRNEILYRQAFDYDTDRKHFVLSDPDIGVWAFRYDPKAPAGKIAVAGGFTARVSAAAGNKPPEMPGDAKQKEKLKEKRLKLPSALNKRIVAMADNSVISLGGGKMPGNEIGWCYDSDAGVMVRYGGCGNGSNPFWTGYGNCLLIYDPGVERYYTRRVADVSGAKRPSTGCTRSTFYDSKRKLTWLFGCASSGPYCPGSTSSAAYDLARDRLNTPKITYQGRLRNVGCVLQYSPDHDIAILPDKGKTWHFNVATATWSARITPNSPGRPYVYQRMAYVKSKKVFLVLGMKGAAPKKGEKDSRVNGTFAYDPAAGKWTDLEARNQPPFRSSKYGFTYDSRNDVAILVGGQRGWNKGAHKDLWVYHVKKNQWEQMKPKPADGLKKLPVFDYTLPTAYDSRHNAVIFCCRNRPYAYRYKK